MRHRDAAAEPPVRRRRSRALAAACALAAALALAAPALAQSLESHSGYNSGYLFAMTRGVAASTLTPALKPLVFLFTVPLDVITLPFAAIGGFFG